jgi:small-conductance mechanosensitive channel
MKRFITIAAIAVALTFVLAPVAFAAPSAAFDMPDVGALLSAVFSSVFFAQVLSLICMIALDWGLGVALAVRAGKFEFAKLANFYRSMIMPMLIGWALFTIVIKFAGYLALKDLSAVLPDSVAAAAYGIVLVSLLAQIASKTKDLFGQQIVGSTEGRA